MMSVSVMLVLCAQHRRSDMTRDFNSKRWQVRYRPTTVNHRNIWGDHWEEQAKPWLVTPVGRGRSYKQYRFDSLPEAWDYADRMSRRVTVELPKVGDHWVPGSGSTGTVTSIVRHDNGIDIYSDDNRITVDGNQIKTVVEVLLSMVKNPYL